MSNYAIFFDKDNVTYRLPVNPEEIETNSVQAIEKYEVLKLGQIAIPTHMELKEYKFECELPGTVLHYVETSGNFRDADGYLNLFSKWRHSLEPVRFIASNGIGDDINTLVLIEELGIVEKSGEEGDKYVSFALLEYKAFGKKSMVIIKEESVPLNSTMLMAVKTGNKTEVINPKSTGYHVVKNGDTIWAIAKKYYGDGSRCNIIFNANKNKIKNPALIQVGWKLRIPTKDEFSKYSAALPSGTKSNTVSIPTFVVGSSGGGGGGGGGGAF
jgi:nucleoid-associated protein YgaU